MILSNLPKKILVVSLAVTVGIIIMPRLAAAYQGSSGSWQTCQPYFRRTIYGPWGAYIMRDDVFRIPGHPRATVCISHERGVPAFGITQSNAASNGPSVAYPEVFYGCVYGACSPGSALPAQVDQLRSTWISAFDRLTYAKGSKFDASFDLWFTRKERSTGQAQGAELMIWMDDQGVRFAQRWRARLDGSWWRVEEWRTRNPANGRTWPLIIFMLARQGGNVRQLPLRPFFRFAEQHEWVQPQYWLESIECGFELWRGGGDLAVTFMRVHLQAPTRPVPYSPSPTATPNAPAQPAGSIPSAFR
jgi:Glycosyl hydrolase family 12